MSVFNAYMELSGKIDAEVIRREKLSHRTTYRIGGPAALFVIPRTYQALMRTFEVLGTEGVPWVVLGRGSNVLVADEGYDGCVVKLGREFSRIEVTDDCRVTAGAGALLNTLISQAQQAGLSGLEILTGVPGTVGGAVSMNAGMRDEWIGSCVESVVTVKPREGMRRYQGTDIEWGYRWCSLPPGEVILEATLRLAPGDRDKIASEMESRLARRRLRQPMGLPSCGSARLGSLRADSCRTAASPGSPLAVHRSPRPMRTSSSTAAVPRPRTSSHACRGCTTGYRLPPASTWCPRLSS